MKVLLMTQNLMDRVRLESRWTAAGIEMAAAEETPDYVVFDLLQPNALAALAAEKSRRPGVSLVAYGPHTHEALLKQAKAGGADHVVANSAIPDWLLKKI